MNANELADELMKCSIPRLFYLDELMNNAAIILRQQQAEIEALKQSKSDGNNKVKMKETTEEYIAKLKAGLATLETSLYEAKMSAQEVNTRKNKQIAEQQTDIGELKLILAQQEIHVECYRNQLRKAQEK